MMLWQVESGSPTRLVPLIDMIWSPIFSLPDLSAGPPCIILAMITVGRMEPQPLSTMTTPRISPLPFSTNTWDHSKRQIRNKRKTENIYSCKKMYLNPVGLFGFLQIINSDLHLSDNNRKTQSAYTNRTQTWYKFYWIQQSKHLESRGEKVCEPFDLITPLVGITSTNHFH